MMILMLLAQLAQGAYVDRPAAASDIVVTGQRLQQAHAACMRDNCPTPQDVQLSIALAEDQFMQGRFLDAKRTLMAAVSRNRAASATYPRALLSLYDAYGTVSFQEGDTQIYRSAVAAQLRILREDLPQTDETTSQAGILYGDMWLRLRNLYNADQAYRSAERRATERGHSTVAMVASLRRVWLLSAFERRGEADRLLADLAGRPGSNTPEMRRLFAVARLRLAANRADHGEIDRLTAELAATAGRRPVLIWAPPYESPADAERGPGRVVGDPLPPGWDMRSGIAWADIGFWIQPDGRTRDATILRGNAPRAQTMPLVAQIGRRRYTAQTEQGSEGQYRIERFTYRASYAVPVRSLIRQRIGLGELTILDLTDPASDAASRTRPS